MSVDETAEKNLPTYGLLTQADHVFLIGKPHVRLKKDAGWGKLEWRWKILEVQPFGIIVLHEDSLCPRPRRIFIPFSNIDDIEEDVAAVDAFVASKE